MFGRMYTGDSVLCSREQDTWELHRNVRDECTALDTNLHHEMVYTIANLVCTICWVCWKQASVDLPAIHESDPLTLLGRQSKHNVQPAMAQWFYRSSSFVIVELVSNSKAQLWGATAAAALNCVLVSVLPGEAR